MSAEISPPTMLSKVPSILTGLFRCYAEVFFLGDPWVGAVLFAATMLNWNVGLSGLFAVIAAWLFARLVHMDERFVESGFYTYNALLVGLSLGSMYTLTTLSLFFIVSVSILTFLLSVVMVNVLRYYLNLPALSLPFVVASGITHLAARRYSNLLIHAPETPALLVSDLGLPLELTGFFRSLSAIFLVPSVIVGMVFSVVLLIRSRILFMLAFAGYFVGTYMRGLMYGNSDQSFRDLSGFNFILIAMAIGGVFLVPSWNSFLIATAAVAVSTILLDAMQVFGNLNGIPAYTLPFNLVTLGVIYTLTLSNHPRLVRLFAATPEETLENDLVRRARFHGHGRTLQLPFFGKWTVWQAFNDEWTHKGAWQYAYDFVITDQDQQTYGDTGQQLKDYYCYRKPVLSPWRGRVVKVVNHLPDNPVGRVDKTNNWGNHIAIYDERGFYVELSHFAESSIKVKTGEWVEVGQVLGLCGNSGYSPQPHLHVHVQTTEQVGSATLPFSFTSYLDGDEFFAIDLPRKGRQVEKASIDSKLDAMTDFLLNEQLHFDVLEQDQLCGETTLTVRMALDGTLYFESSHGGRLYFGKHAGTFYFYRLEGRDRLLGLIYQAIPRLPLVRRERLEWSDYAPIGLVISGVRRVASQFMAPVFSHAGRAITSHRFVDRMTIESTIRVPFWGIQRTARVEFDAEHGFASIRVGATELRLRKPKGKPIQNDAAPEPLVEDPAQKMEDFALPRLATWEKQI